METNAVLFAFYSPAELLLLQERDAIVKQLECIKEAIELLEDQERVASGKLAACEYKLFKSQAHVDNRHHPTTKIRTGSIDPGAVLKAAEAMNRLYQLNIDKFRTFRVESSSAILDPMNPYELVRFQGKGGLGSVYQGKRDLTLTGEAEIALSFFELNRSWRANRKYQAWERPELVERLLERYRDESVSTADNRLAKSSRSNTFSPRSTEAIVETRTCASHIRSETRWSIRSPS